MDNVYTTDAATAAAIAAAAAAAVTAASDKRGISPLKAQQKLAQGLFGPTGWKKGVERKREEELASGKGRREDEGIFPLLFFQLPPPLPPSPPPPPPPSPPPRTPPPLLPPPLHFSQLIFVL
uniref:Uncharacterized protein n=1 Tax=Vespula pensylvanica TaxID=30213 RepID=A0A834NQ41_VESPE|nr:hypothetical protein H0235_011966 [Vespula pensylvanica]